MADEIISKRCSKCKEIKPISEFHKNKVRKDGLQGYCKPCKKIYEMTYQKTEKGKAAQKRHRKSDKRKASQKRYNQSEKGKANLRAKQERFNARHPNFIKAKHAVNNAIQVGKLPRPDNLRCHYCDHPAKHYHHYKGYAPEHWLDVVPVCVPCHVKHRYR